ncbi:hypothetical protein OQA88_9247 [Cercophora sp. LCS_1]
MAAITPFQTLFAVPMTCDGCVRDISGALHKLRGITKVEANLQDQLVLIEGTGAAVSILETFHEGGPDAAPTNEDGGNQRYVRGLARMVQVNSTTTLVDLTLRGVKPGNYYATIREYGNLANGAPSTGPVWFSKATETKTDGSARGFLGTLKVGPDGHGSVFVNHPFQIWEVIGHAMVVSSQDESNGSPLTNDENTVVGVIARSAGMWDNDKTVCSCTGKTLWEERKDEVSKGML